MSSDTPTIVEHLDNPQWGRGVVLPQQDGRSDRLDISFEAGGRRTILKTFAAKLKAVVMPEEEAKARGARLAHRRSAAAPSRAKAKKPKASASSFANFEAQLALFLKAFPEGFAGEKFDREVRAVPGGKRKKTDGAPDLAEAIAALSAQSFAEREASWIFEAAVKLVKDTGFVHPLEGANLLSAMPEESRVAFVAALRELLHGSDEAGDRFDRFVSAVKLPDGKEGTKRPSWPVATVFAALVHPTQHVCVKPTVFQKQAALMGVGLEYESTPSSTVYARFLETARKTEEALKAAGQQPKDLVDVASFIGFTHSAKPAASS